MISAVTLRMIEKLIEEHYKVVPDFFEEEAAITYCFEIKNTETKDIIVTLHVYETEIKLIIETYGGKEKEDLIDKEIFFATSYKEISAKMWEKITATYDSYA